MGCTYSFIRRSYPTNINTTLSRPRRFHSAFTPRYVLTANARYTDSIATHVSVNYTANLSPAVHSVCRFSMPASRSTIRQNTFRSIPCTLGRRRGSKKFHNKRIPSLSIIVLILITNTTELLGSLLLRTATILSGREFA